MKLGQPVDLRLSPRYYQFNRGFAIRDAFDALVELITNSDDSYHRLYKKGLRSEDGGPILIEYIEQRKDKDWSLTDCLSFAVMHARDLSEALTGDHHFQQAGFRALLRET